VTGPGRRVAEAAGGRNGSLVEAPDLRAALEAALEDRAVR
jgi:hypothetical protein